MPDSLKHKFSNHLITESSPYLLQHAHNPVDWHAWNPGTLTKAAKEDKMMLISIGYSACHWCHVMEHECFENEHLARLMNDNFVCIKVDREERPDVDAVYMSAVQLINGNGGWPLNCFALPDGRPFFGGTYFPQSQWEALLKNIADLFRNRRKDLEKQAAQIMEGINQENIIQPLNIQAPATIILAEAVNKMEKRFDNVHGGSSGAPKFPLPAVYNFLLTMAFETKNEKLLTHIHLTLGKMAKGGIYDQIGGGFARYSVDERWKVPHFEKMLYDNAQLISLYTKAYQFTGLNQYLNIANECADFVTEELTSPEGIFYSALDADSEGREGKFYVWKKQEFDQALGADSQLIGEYFQIDGEALWEHGENVLQRKYDPQDFIIRKNMDAPTFLQKLEEAKIKLMKQRNKRTRPGLDDKSLVSWNGLMIKALAQLSAVTKNPRYLSAALLAAEIILQKMFSPITGLKHNYKNGHTSISGFLEDYALMAEAAIELYQVTLEEKWLFFSRNLTDFAVTNFYDPEDGLFWFTGKNSHDLVSRKKEIYDNVIPSSNSVMAVVLLKLSKYLGKSNYHDMAEKMQTTMIGYVEKYPLSFSNWADFFNMMSGNFYEVVATGRNAGEFVPEIYRNYHPARIIAGAKSKSDLPLFQDRFVNEKTIIYVCKGNYCKKPVETVAEALEQMA
jgi:uncharacterized protein